MPPSLWRSSDFLKLWLGQTVTVFGTLVSQLALPFTAVLLLDATSMDMGLLRAARLSGGFIFGLIAGVWADRLRRRPILVWTDLGRAALLLTIPLAAMLGALRIEHLLLVSFLSGILTIWFTVAYRSYVPMVIPRAQLLDANGKLTAAASVAEVAGFGLAGAIVQVLSAPVAFFLDAVTYLVSAISLLLIHRPEPPPAPSEQRSGIVAETITGLRFVLRAPVLRALLVATAAIGMFTEMMGAAWLIYVTRDLEVNPALQGAIYAVGGVGSLIGASYAERAVARWGYARVLIGSATLWAVGSFLLPLAGGPGLLTIILLVAQQLTVDPGMTAFEISETTIKQQATPDELLGRMNACYQFVGWSAMLAGALMGGFLGDSLGMRETLFVGAGGLTLTLAYLLLSPVRTLERAPSRACGFADRR
ncbi:MAG: MFS transporter [Chloroflexota bacterium]